MVTLRVAVIPVACVAVLLGFPWPTSGQDQSPLVEDEWQPATRVFWHVEAGYPIRASGGGTVLVGRSRRLDGYQSLLRGIFASADLGFVSAGARVGWAQLRPYDAGIEGWSAELMVARPMGFSSRLDDSTTYLGPAASWYAGLFRVSGGVLVGATRREVVPVVTAAIVLPVIY